MSNKFLFIPQWRTLATASIPDTEYKLLYPKSTDGNWYFVGSDGSEKRVETGLDFVNGINTTNYGTSSLLRARLDIALGSGLTFSGNFAGSTISVYDIVPSMLKSTTTATAGYIPVSTGSSFIWVTSSSLIGGTGSTGATGSTGNTGATGPTGPIGSTGSMLAYSKELISGGAIWNSNLTFDVSVLNYTFNGPPQSTSGATQVTFATGSATYSRIDALVVNDDSPYGLVSIIQGISSPTPITPEIPNSELLVQYVLIPSGATSLSFNQDFIYNENTEWTGSVYDFSGAVGTFSFTSSTPTAYSGTYSLRVTGNNRKRTARFTRISTIVSSDYSSLSFNIYFPSVITTRNLVVRFLLGGIYVGNLVNVTPTFASISVTGSWQSVVVPLYLFNLTGNIDGIEFQLSGRSDSDFKDWSLDFVQLQSGYAPTYLTSTLGPTVSYGNGIGLTGVAVVLGGTLSQPTIIDVSTQSLALISVIDLNIPHFYGLLVESNVSQLGYTNQGSTSSILATSIDAVSMITSDGTSQFSLSLDQYTNQALLIDTFNSKGLEYGGSYSGNFTTYSLVDKFYVDTELSSFLPLSGGTLSGNLEINGTTSNTLTLYSSGTGSTIFRVQGTSGELFSVVDGLTGSLFSVNNISGLPILEVFSDDTILMGDYVAPSLNSTFKVTTVTGSNTIYSIDKSLYTGAFFEYTVTKGTNARAGSIMSVWNGLTASYTETFTTDIGLTTDIIFLVSATGSNAILTASASSNNWIIKTIVRSI